MNALHPVHQTPKERLEYVASQSKPCPHEVAPRNYFTTIGLLLFMLVMIAVGIMAAMLGSDILGEYARRIQDMALP
jgi:hypothetical protein